MKRILVLGGTGLVGRDVCEKAGQLQCRVTVPTRRLESAKKIQSLPWVDPIEADIHDEAALTRLVRGHDAVVNLVAILHGNQAAFSKVHVELVQKLVRACNAAGVHRVVHVSALGAAADAKSMYQRSKAQGEAVLAASKLDVTILRPSLIFGSGDQSINLFARLQARLPFIPLGGADARFQPVWVEDVAQAIVTLLRDRKEVGVAGDQGEAPVYEACGPDVYTLKQLVQEAGRLSGNQRTVFSLPGPLARLQAGVMELAPGPPMLSRDNLDAMASDNVASGVLPGLRELGITASALAVIAPNYLDSGEAGLLLMRRKAAGRF
jgi:uncharacterized protein YbjT (DUF2867 family)